MTNEDLEKMKIYFNLLEAKNENYKKLINRKKELEEELLIKEYLCLLKKKLSMMEKFYLMMIS